MRIFSGVILLLMTAWAFAEQRTFANEAEMTQWLESNKQKVEGGEFSDQGAATVRALIEFSRIRGFEVVITSPQIVSFAEGVSGFSKPNENVWEISINDTKSSKYYLYFVHPISGKVIQRCLDANHVLTSRCP